MKRTLCEVPQDLVLPKTTISKQCSNDCKCISI